MTLYRDRAQAVRQLVDQAREIEKSGVTPANLDKIGVLLSALARRAELFPQEEFPLGADGGIYRLSKDPDHRFALYASAGAPDSRVLAFSIDHATGKLAALPTILINSTQANFFFGGTSLLIVIGVALDTMKQLEAQLMMRNYEGFLK